MTQNIHKESVVSERNSSKGVGGLARNPSLTAGLAYFASVFAIGFVLGLIRIPFLVPLFGDITAVLIELPIILRQPANKNVPTNPLLGGTVGSRGRSLLITMPKLDWKLIYLA